MYNNFDTKIKNVFFTCGESQKQIIKKLNNYGYKCKYFFNKKLNYEINAVINLKRY